MFKFIRAYFEPWLVRQSVYRRPKQKGLLEMVDEARLAWQDAFREYSLGDREVVEYLIYKINAAEKRYIVLLKQARAQGVTAWPVEHLKPVVPVAASSGENSDEGR
ncbi:MAG: YaaL family protein [Armatimonadetes bacterium]|nr:YaaL family protein [Armatimonadota bacterium]